MTISPGNVLALIPARSGSKSIPDKNIRDFAGKPLLAHSILQARASGRIGRVIVSTDAEHYATIARTFGAETPFLRPAELALDDSTDFVVFLHALDWLRDNEGWQPDIVVHLRPTYPNRDPADIDRVVDILSNDMTLDSVRTIAPAPATPYKMWTRRADGLLSPVADLGDEAYNQPRQQLPQVFLQNAGIDAVRTRVLRQQRSMTGRRIHGYVMGHNFDIDTFADLEGARVHLPDEERGSARTFCIDLDSVLGQGKSCSGVGPLRPRTDVIAVVNRLHHAGCRIVVCAAPHKAEAQAQLRQWGVAYHELSCDRLAADYVVDGRAVTIEEFLEIADAIVQ